MARPRGHERAGHKTLAGRGTFALALCWLLTAAFATPALAKAPSAGTLAAYLREDKALAYELAGIEGAKLGVSLPGGPEFFIHLKQSPKYSLAGQVGAEPIDAAALTDYDFIADGAPVGCTIEVAAGPHKLGTMRATVAHEVFHCFEVVMAGDQANWDRKPEPHWLVEGAAEWAGAELAGGKDPVANDERGVYYEHPATPLFNRTYDAIGFFDHMQSVGISPWSRFKAMFAASSNLTAYLNGVGASTEFPETEASVFFREPSGWPWAPRPESEPGPGSVHFTPSTVAVGAGGHPPIAVARFADGVYHLSLIRMSTSKPILELVVKSGNVRIRSLAGADVDEVVKGDVKLCSAKSGCDCPGQPKDDYPLFREGDLAIAGGLTGGDVELVAHKRCEPLLAARSCEGALPGYSSEVAAITEQRLKALEPGPIGKFEKSEASDPADGYFSTTCLFLYKETSKIVMIPRTSAEPGESPEEEEVFRGVLVSGFNISRYGSPAAATAGLRMQAQLAASATPLHGIGEEAFLTTSEEKNSRGETEYRSDGFVRERNLTAYFLIAGDEEANNSAALRLLDDVADEL